MRGNLWTYEGDYDRQDRIADLVVRYSVHPKIREIALKIVASCPDYDDLCELQKIFDWVQKNIRYRSDVAYIDSYHSPLRILELKAADCDDFTILIDSLLASLGWTVGAKIIAKKKNTPFHHIYPIVIYPKTCKPKIIKQGGKPIAIIPPICKVIPLDPSVKTLRCCQEVSHEKEKVFIYLPDFVVEG